LTLSDLAKNQNAKQALNSVGTTVEGFNTLALVLSQAKKHQIEMPICEQVKQVVDGQALLVNQILAVQYSVLLINAEQMLGNEPLAKWQ
jgi:glycerol-3-phosphate dehydrogenase (NAD(P)+)